MRIAITLLLVACIPPLAASQDLPADYPDTYPSHYFAFFPADSTTYPAVYPDQATRDSIATRFNSDHRAARAVEDYALGAQDIRFAERTKSLAGDRLRWNISYAGQDGAVQFAPSLTSDPDSLHEDLRDWTFEYYYQHEKLAVFQKWKEEGKTFKPNGYLLLSREAGMREDLLGRPVFSPSMDLFVTLKGSVSGGPTDNAIQLFRITDDKKIRHILTFRTAHTPSQCKWTDGSTLMLEAFDLSFNLEDGYTVHGRRHHRVEIRKPRH